MGRKRMREGTRSCTECRRRKIRCIFNPPDQVCSPCQARGSRCVDQRDASPGETTPAAQRAPPALKRRQVSAPIVSPHGQERRPSRETPVADISIIPIHGGRQSSSHHQDPVSDAPIMSALHTSGACAGSTGGGERPLRGSSRAAVAPAVDMCRALRSVMPAYDEVLATLPTAGGGACWWRSFRLKMQTLDPSQTRQPGGSGGPADPLEPLESFAARAYTSVASPAVLGTLAVAYARSLQAGSSGSGRRAMSAAKIYGEVESLVLSDMVYAATGEGLECLVLLAYCYMDSGMPRRAWFLWRKGLGIAQMMGLYRLTATSPPSHTRLWHAVYHGDLFASLVLGLPRGFQNPYHVSGLGRPPRPSEATGNDGGGSWMEHFVRECTLLAGKVIDRNAFGLADGNTDKDDSLLQALRELEELPPDGWWDVPAPLPAGSGLALDFAVAGLLLQVFYFHTTMYIHLPALAGASSAECASAASNLLQRYLPLRDGPSPAFESITSDFVAFTAAVVLALCKPPPRVTAAASQGSAPSAGIQGVGERTREDMMAGALAMFRRLERQAMDRDGDGGSRRNCLPGQCRKILELLYGGRRQLTNVQEIRIPYFGRVFLRPAASGPSAAQQQLDHSRQLSSGMVEPLGRHAQLEGGELSVSVVPTPSSERSVSTMEAAPPGTGPPEDHQRQAQGHDNIMSTFWGGDGLPALLEFTPELGGGGEGHFDIFSAADLPLSSDATFLDPGQHDWGLW
ncbi:hypothetical protein RB595_008275 [Gaeumannomyces hyphopodioides]